jgi:hypothetical protein
MKKLILFFLFFSFVTPTFIEPDHPSLNYIGRIDNQDKKKPV